MIRVRVIRLPLESNREGHVYGEGATVLRAARDGIRQLCGRVGAVEMTRLDTHRWDVEATGLGRFRVSEARSGPGERGGGTRVVSLSLPVDTVQALDAQVEAAGMSRSAYVAELVRRNGESPRAKAGA